MKLCPQCESGYHDSHAICPTHGGLLSEIRDLKPGMLIHKTYKIVRKLGQGGMGTVYLAEHVFMEEQRALKFLAAELCQDDSFTGRFRREVRTLKQIRHKNVIDCGDLEPAEDDSLFFPMEFVNGPDLWQLIRHSPKPFDVALALSITRGIVEGLGVAHQLGMVHRDIKPENILMAQVGQVWVPKIADFGIVATKESGSMRSRTKTGGTLLTMAYAAPEQWRGVRASELDGRTDFYALGGVLHELLTGQTPFDAESYEGWAEAHKNHEPAPPSTLRPDLAQWPGLDALVLQMLAKDRGLRPANAAEVVAKIDEIILKHTSGAQTDRVAETPDHRGSEVMDSDAPVVHAEPIRSGPTPSERPQTRIEPAYELTSLADSAVTAQSESIPAASGTEVMAPEANETPAITVKLLSRFGKVLISWFALIFGFLHLPSIVEQVNNSFSVETMRLFAFAYEYFYRGVPPMLMAAIGIAFMVAAIAIQTTRRLRLAGALLGAISMLLLLAVDYSFVYQNSTAKDLAADPLPVLTAAAVIGAFLLAAGNPGQNLLILRPISLVGRILFLASLCIRGITLLFINDAPTEAIFGGLEILLSLAIAYCLWKRKSPWWFALALAPVDVAFAPVTHLPAFTATPVPMLMILFESGAIAGGALILAVSQRTNPARIAPAN